MRARGVRNIAPVARRASGRVRREYGAQAADGATDRRIAPARISPDISIAMSTDTRTETRWESCGTTDATLVREAVMPPDGEPQPPQQVSGNSQPNNATRRVLYRRAAASVEEAVRGVAAGQAGYFSRWARPSRRAMSAYGSVRRVFLLRADIRARPGSRRLVRTGLRGAVRNRRPGRAASWVIISAARRSR
jgi:hypothetical protein